MRADAKLIAVAHEAVKDDVRGDVKAEVAPTTTESAPAPARKRRAHWFTLRQGITVSSYRLLALGGFAALFALWAWVSHRESMNPVFVPTPGRRSSSVMSRCRGSGYMSGPKSRVLSPES